MPSFSVIRFVIRLLISRLSLGVLVTGLITSLVGCQPPNTPPPELIGRAIDSLRKQQGIPPTTPVDVISQNLQKVNGDDICQTSDPKQYAYIFNLNAGDINYMVHLVSDSRIEVCSAQQKPTPNNRYNGAGYELQYPKTWYLFDSGLRSNGISQVLIAPKKVSAIDLSEALSQLQIFNQSFILISREPVSATTLQVKKQLSLEDSIFFRQNLTAVQPDTLPVPDGFKENLASKPKNQNGQNGQNNNLPYLNQQRFSVGVIDGSGSMQRWQGVAMTVQTSKYFYILQFVEPPVGNPDHKQVFEQLVNSFKLLLR